MAEIQYYEQVSIITKTEFGENIHHFMSGMKISYSLGINSTVESK